MRNTTITCDICTRAKSETNHWFFACEHGGALYVGHTNGLIAENVEGADVCGEECLHKWISSHLSSLEETIA